MKKRSQEVGPRPPQVAGPRVTTGVVKDGSPVGHTPEKVWQVPQAEIPPKGWWSLPPDEEAVKGCIPVRSGG